MGGKPNKNLPVSNLLDGGQVAQKFQSFGLRDLNARWVKGQADRGMLPYVVVNRKRRYREDLIDQIIQQWSDAAA
jgi:hypothetical protein